MKRFVASALDKKFTGIKNSWCYIHDSFEKDFQELESAGTLRLDGPFQIIWKTKQKFVLKAAAPSGRTIAYKSYIKLKATFKYLFRLSPCGMEAMNFKLVSDCNIPLPRLLAVGDIRRKRVLKTAFLITEFAEGYTDGRDFTPLKKVITDPALLDEFILRNMEMLARLHDNNILHRGFTPANLLYRLRETPDENGNKLDLMWIDIASCRKHFRFVLKRSIVIDFEQLFRFFEFSEEKLFAYLQHYYRMSERPLKHPEKLLKMLKKQLSKRKNNA